MKLLLYIFLRRLHAQQASNRCTEQDSTQRSAMLVWHLWYICCSALWVELSHGFPVVGDLSLNLRQTADSNMLQDHIVDSTPVSQEHFLQGMRAAAVLRPAVVCPVPGTAQSVPAPVPGTFSICKHSGVSLKAGVHQPSMSSPELNLEAGRCAQQAGKKVQQCAFAASWRPKNQSNAPLPH